MTVSLALRNSPQISEKTRQRVVEAATALGYTPDPLVSALASRRWKGGSSELANSIFISFLRESVSYDFQFAQSERDLFHGAKKAAAGLGHHLEQLTLSEDAGIRSLDNLLRSRGVTGLLVSNLDSQEVLEQIEWANYCAVGLGRGFAEAVFDNVSYSVSKSMDLAWRRTIEAGHRKIGLAVLDSDDDAGAIDRLGPALYHRSQLPDSEAIPIFRYGTAIDPDSLSRWIAKHRPSALIGTSGDVLQSLLDQCGLEVPKDISFVSSSLLDGFAPSGVTGSVHNWERVGELGFTQLDALIRSNRRGIPSNPLSIRIDAKFRPGSTLAQIGA